MALLQVRSGATTLPFSALAISSSASVPWSGNVAKHFALYRAKAEGGHSIPPYGPEMRNEALRRPYSSR